MAAPARRRLGIVLGALVVLAGVVIALVAYQRFENVDVEGKAAAFDILDDHTVVVTISVTRKDPSQPVVCIARTRSKDGVETGRQERSWCRRRSQKTVQVKTTVNSFKRAFVGDVYGCQDPTFRGTSSRAERGENPPIAADLGVTLATCTVPAGSRVLLHLRDDSPLSNARISTAVPSSNPIPAASIADQHLRSATR